MPMNIQVPVRNESKLALPWGRCSCYNSGLDTHRDTLTRLAEARVCVNRLDAVTVDRWSARRCHPLGRVIPLLSVNPFKILMCTSTADRLSAGNDEVYLDLLLRGLLRRLVIRAPRNTGWCGLKTRRRRVFPFGFRSRNHEGRSDSPTRRVHISRSTFHLLLTRCRRKDRCGLVEVNDILQPKLPIHG